MAFRSILLSVFISYAVIIAASPIEDPLPESGKVEIENVEPTSQNDNSLNVQESSPDDEVSEEDSNEGPQSAGFAGLKKGARVAGKVAKAVGRGSRKVVNKVIDGTKRTYHKVKTGTGKVINRFNRPHKNSLTKERKPSSLSHKNHHNSKPNHRKLTSTLNSVGKWVGGTAREALVVGTQATIENLPAILDVIGNNQRENARLNAQLAYINSNGKDVSDEYDEYNESDESDKSDKSRNDSSKADYRVCSELAAKECSERAKDSEKSIDLVECMKNYVCQQ